MPELIAEVKTHSPFGWESDRTWEELFAIAAHVGDIISVHTDERWGGSFDLLAKARAQTNKPILAKGIHESDDDIRRALDLGADRVLVVGRIPETHVEACLIEPYTFDELAELAHQNVRAVWNSRDLTTGGTKPETFAEARMIFDGWLCQASNVEHLGDIDQTAQAVLIGTHLPTIARELRGL